jgi:hypothetical protein
MLKDRDVAAFFTCVFPIFPTPFIEKPVFLHCVFLTTFAKISWLHPKDAKKDQYMQIKNIIFHITKKMTKPYHLGHFSRCLKGIQ